jgi:hypothetical protein
MSTFTLPMAPRRRRRLAMCAAASMMGALGLAQLGSAPAAHADEACDPDHITPLCADLESAYAPTGVLVGVGRRPGGISLGGWARDQDVPNGPIAIRITVNGQTAGTVKANSMRADGALDFNGFVPTNATGNVTVQAWAQDDVGTLETNLGSKSITLSSDPVGYLDDVQSGASSVWVRGWAIDPDVAAPISVHVYQDGAFVTAATADSTRNDVAAAYPGYGALPRPAALPRRIHRRDQLRGLRPRRRVRAVDQRRDAARRQPHRLEVTDPTRARRRRDDLLLPRLRLQLLG